MPIGQPIPPPHEFGEEFLQSLRRVLETDPHEVSWPITLYTSYGIVHAHFKRATAQGAPPPRETATARVHEWSPRLIGVEDAEVEHYWSHLSDASYRLLYVNVSDIRAFAIGDSSNSSYT